MAWLGVEIDPEANAAHAKLVSSRRSKIPVYRLATDEEMMIARHTVALLAGRTPKREKVA
jgi:acetate kinase